MFADLVGDEVLLAVGQLREHGQGYDLRCRTLSHREGAFSIAKVFVSFLKMKWNRVVNAGANASLSERRLQSLAVRHANHVEMIDTLCPGCLDRNHKGILSLGEQFVIPMREVAA